MSRWIEIAKMRPKEAAKALSAIRRAAERKGLLSDALVNEWADSACVAALSVRGLRSDLFREMGTGVRRFDHWTEARHHAAWMLRKLGLTLEQASKHLNCERTAVSRMSRRYSPL